MTHFVMPALFFILLATTALFLSSCGMETDTPYDVTADTGADDPCTDEQFLTSDCADSGSGSGDDTHDTGTAVTFEDEEEINK